MDWSAEIVASLWWILKCLAITAVVFGAAMFALIKSTTWGQQFWSMAAGFLSPKRSIKPLLFFVFIVTLTLLEVRISLIHSNWYNAMYASLEAFDQQVFWQQMLIFCFIAAAAVTNALLTYYAEQRFSINWIEWLNKNLLDKWLANRAYYKTQQIFNEVDNPDQRIQQDVQAYVRTSLSLATGVISAVTSIISFTLLLWTLSGPMTLLGVEIPHMMVFLVFIYVLFATVIAFWLGRPLINLNFANEKLNANYRYSLIRVKEYAESIAFYAGEKAEKNLLYRQFNHVIGNMWAIVFRTLKFSGFNLIITQISVVFPLIIQVGRYFNKQINLGDLMQTMQVFSRLHGNLSYFRNVYDTFAEYQATLNRLTGFENAIKQSAAANVTQVRHHDSDVIFHDLTVKSPAGKTLISNLNLTLPQGSRLLIQGKSGLGKTTLLRTAAGLWSYSDGAISRPDDALFLSQKPYLPQGRLSDALYYPQIAPDENDAAATKQAQDLLERVQLGHLAARLHEPNDWTRVLSLGEQQRLAFARLLLHRPTVAFLDEASASLDEGLEDAMYRLLADALPNTTIISVGHRSTLLAHHEIRLEILEGQQWQVQKV
ncbi:ABC transporter ATP-binding protein [Moraxella caviae]|uniref:ABC transporter ATP-binding protein n=1 Tax=Moraxella caviae TaxID=34060 RepID=A0A1S9ZXB7_9GAMM|nr:ABC transporter ATP-binding protein/permease [Moraxella caviae]OOR88088.1 ABC transporter ATP-binding protein [Moraxella caviae]STZ09967.1 CDS102 [Moraxella caviae]VEW11245.1 CDS102 [Moraxella caviae]